VVLERALGIGSLIQVEGPCDMDFKRRSVQKFDLAEIA
jgi:hypothetical protein